MNYELRTPIKLSERDNLNLCQFCDDYAVVEYNNVKMKYGYGRLFRKNIAQIILICEQIGKLSGKDAKKIYMPIAEEILNLKSEGATIPKELFEMVFLLMYHSPPNYTAKEQRERFAQLFQKEVGAFDINSITKNYIYQPEVLQEERIERWDPEDLLSGRIF